MTANGHDATSSSNGVDDDTDMENGETSPFSESVLPDDDEEIVCT